MVRVPPPVFVLLLFAAVAVVKANSGDKLVRKRREWIIPPRSLTEHKDYTQETYIAKIRSDYEVHDDIEYSLEGVGASQDPYNVFVVDPKTGLIRVTKVLDREVIAMYNLSGIARYKDGTEAEKRIDIRIKVEDINDNSPVFPNIEPGKVHELSPAGTSVMKVTATDADEPGNKNSMISYSIIQQEPSHDMFYISSDGSIYVSKPTLDREKADHYVLTVKGRDLNGSPEGNTGTGTVTIKVLDVNDNLPTLEKEAYEGSIDENTQGVEVMRLKAEDLDLEGTDNWEAVFDIVKGNEAGYFSIKTDPKTNEGILMLDKAVNYEDVKDLDLGISVRNKAPPYGVPSPATGASGGGSWQSGTTFKTYPVKINVKNQPEGPAFDPKVKTIPISEGGNSININDVIARYPALDGDTGKPAENVRYAKGSDPDNWLTIDPKTAEIKLNKMPDRESKFLVNGTYFAKVLCITEDQPAKTATGTIAVQVEDFNDHCPTLTSNIQTMCTTDNSVIVNAKDEDVFPNGPPFDFAIISEGKWQVEHLNDTAAILRAQESMWPGVYEVEFVVKDQQGHSCPEPQKVKVQVCTCEDGVQCGKRGSSGQSSKGVEFGPAGIGLLLLGLLLLLLIPLLLLFCQCGGVAGFPGNFTEMPFDTKSHLISYHTEGQGENTELPLLNMPMQLDEDTAKVGMGMANKISAMPPMGGLDLQKSVISIDGMNGAVYQESFSNGHREGTWRMMNQMMGSGFYSEVQGRESGVGGGIYDGMALPHHFLRQYYTQKVASGNENLEVKDSLLVYDYEGQGSPAGSVGCCSLLESDNDLQFLDDLSLKFKTLAEVCEGKKIQTEVKEVLTPLPSSTINTQSSVSSVATTQQLPPPPQLQPTVLRSEQSVVRETSERSQAVKENTATLRQGMTTVKEGMASQGQVLLLQQQQQPVYLTTTPMLQPMHYVVQPQVQNTLLLAEAPATNLQSMVLVNGTQTGPAQSMVIQGQPVMSSGQAQGTAMMLVETGGVQGGSSNLIQTTNLSGSQKMMVVEGKVPAGSMKVLKGSQTCVVPGGTLKSGGLSGSQRVLVVGGPVSSGGQLVQETRDLSQKSDISGSQRVLYSKSSTSAESQSSMVGSSTTTVNTTPSYRKVVVQETREIH
uniref:desmoglein-2-like n=1 Tax=Scatophagus argus TaxID=75038 RepID=UPI001ED83467|nr:desmoglein-2-like [Scatophagus argus]